MQLELSQLELRYEKLRRKNRSKERSLTGSLSERGQLSPVVVVRAEAPAEKYVLLDGYKRVRALHRLAHDTVVATTWQLSELEALLLERLMRKGEADNAIEQGLLLEELNERFGLSAGELGRRFDKSQSWVSRRLGLVRALPPQVRESVQEGCLPAHAAMKYLLPMARAKNADCVRLVSALSQMRAEFHPSSRDLGALYMAWSNADEQGRELLLKDPSLVLRARAASQSRREKKPKSPAEALLDDLSIIIGASRRARQKVWLIAELVVTQTERVRNLVQQACWESDALFRQAKAALNEERREETADAR